MSRDILTRGSVWPRFGSKDSGILAIEAFALDKAVSFALVLPSVRSPVVAANKAPATIPGRHATSILFVIFIFDCSPSSSPLQSSICLYVTYVVVRFDASTDANPHYV